MEMNDFLLSIPIEIKNLYYSLHFVTILPATWNMNC